MRRVIDLPCLCKVRPYRPSCSPIETAGWRCNDDLALNKRVPGLKLFDIKCDWFDEHVYNEYFPRLALKRQLR